MYHLDKIQPINSTKKNFQQKKIPLGKNHKNKKRIRNKSQLEKIPSEKNLLEINRTSS